MLFFKVGSLYTSGFYEILVKSISEISQYFVKGLGRAGIESSRKILKRCLLLRNCKRITTKIKKRQKCGSEVFVSRNDPSFIENTIIELLTVTENARNRKKILNI